MITFAFDGGLRQTNRFSLSFALNTARILLRRVQMRGYALIIWLLVPFSTFNHPPADLCVEYIDIQGRHIVLTWLSEVFQLKKGVIIYKLNNYGLHQLGYSIRTKSQWLLKCYESVKWKQIIYNHTSTKHMTRA